MEPVEPNETKGKGVVICGIHWRKIRFLCASVFAFVLMLIGIILIVVIVKTKDSRAVTTYCLLDFAAGIVFIAILRILDRASVPEEIRDTTNDKAKKKRRRKKNNGISTLETAMEVADTAIETASVTVDCCCGGDTGGNDIDSESCCDCSCFSD